MPEPEQLITTRLALTDIVLIFIRPNNGAALKAILGKPVEKIVNARELDLCIDPVSVSTAKEHTRVVLTLQRSIIECSTTKKVNPGWLVQSQETLTHTTRSMSTLLRVLLSINVCLSPSLRRAQHLILVFCRIDPAPTLDEFGPGIPIPQYRIRAIRLEMHGKGNAIGATGCNTVRGR